MDSVDEQRLVLSEDNMKIMKNNKKKMGLGLGLKYAIKREGNFLKKDIFSYYLSFILNFFIPLVFSPLVNNDVYPKMIGNV